MAEYTEYDFGYAIVRIHPGKRTEEERKEALTNAAQKFYRHIYARRNANGNADSGNGITAQSSNGSTSANAV